MARSSDGPAPRDFKTAELGLPERIVASLLYRFYYRVYRRLRNVIDRRYVNRYDANIMPTVLAMRGKAGVVKTDHPHQGADFLRIIERLKPKSIFELGSGQSTPFFSAYAVRHDAKFVSFEEIDEWRKLSDEACRELTGQTPTRLCETQSVSMAGRRYQPDIDLDAELLYIDGPTVRIEQRPGGKGIKADAYEHISRGGRPRAIIYEGGTESVDHLLSHPAIGAYDFRPEFIYAWRKRNWAQALRFRRHSLFVLKDAGGPATHDG